VLRISDFTSWRVCHSVYHNHPDLACLGNASAGTFMSALALRLRLPQNPADPGPLRNSRSGRLPASEQIQMASLPDKGKKHALRRTLHTPARWQILANPDAPRVNGKHKFQSARYEQRTTSLVIDHINGDGLDNRRANLRLATVAQNAWNSKKRNSRSGYKGVWFARDKGLWRAAIVYHGRRIHLGYFKDKISDAKAYDTAARKYYGEFAKPNFSK
jgi:hypothetical protein